MNATAASASISAVAPAAPPPGSVRYFVLLYCPRERRAALASVLAIGDELESGLARQLDHSVAHLRLQWWQQEAERFAQGQPQHPWLRSLHGDAAALDLSALVAAAAADLATQTLAAQSGTELHRALFELAAQWLAGPDLAAPQRQRVGQLGMTALALPQQPAQSAAASVPVLQRQMGALPAATQAALTPLLVWCALLIRAHQRRDRTPSRADGLTEALAAWRAARRAARGRFSRP